MITVSLDAMGGDHAPHEVVKGALQALDEYKQLNLQLYGPKAEVEKALFSSGVKEIPSRISIVDAPEVVGMSESPSKSFREKKQSSIRLGIESVNERRADAFVSAGNTGAVMAASLLTYGRIKHVERPPLATPMPSKKGPFILLDVGSNADCKPSHLAQFSIMGKYLAELILKQPNPSVGLLNIGEEKDKGNNLTVETYKLLEKLPLNFIGNLEGKDILKGNADVVVCDGFVGNTVLKFGEGLVSILQDFFKDEAKKSLLSIIGLIFLAPALKKFKKMYDYQEYGGAPLVGLNRISVVAHGKSHAKAIKSAIGIAIKSVDSKLVEHITSSIEEFTQLVASHHQQAKEEAL